MNEITNPFNVTPDDFIKMPPEKQAELRKKVFIVVKSQLARLFTRGYVYACFCGSSSEPTFTALNVDLVPNPTRVVIYAKQKNKVPFEFFRHEIKYVRELPL